MFVLKLVRYRVSITLSLASNGRRALGVLSSCSPLMSFSRRPGKCNKASCIWIETSQSGHNTSNTTVLPSICISLSVSLNILSPPPSVFSTLWLSVTRVPCQDSAFDVYSPTRIRNRRIDSRPYPFAQYDDGRGPRTGPIPVAAWMPWSVLRTHPKAPCKRNQTDPSDAARMPCDKDSHTAFGSPCMVVILRTSISQGSRVSM